MPTIEIPLSTKKLLLIVLGAIVFMALGLIFILYPEPFARRLAGSALLVQLLGGVCLLLFSLFAITAVQKLWSRKIGLRIDEEGITDHSHANSVGLIPWRDIEGFDLVQVYSTKTIMVRVANPDHYIQNATDVISRRAMKANSKMYGSPVSLVANTLQISADDLYALVVSEHSKWKTQRVV